MNQTSFWEQSWKRLDPARVSALLEGFDFSDDAILQTLRARGVRTVCDAGCGCGVYALKLARHGFFVSGFDLSEDAAGMTRRLLAKNGAAHGDFQAADVSDTGYPDGAFDAVVARDVLDHMPIRSAAAALEELLRILRLGGCLLLCLDQTDAEYESEPHRANADGDYLFSAGKWAGMVFHPYSPADIEILCSGRSVEVLPQEQGYLVILEKDTEKTNTGGRYERI